MLLSILESRYGLVSHLTGEEEAEGTWCFGMGVSVPSHTVFDQEKGRSFPYPIRRTPLHLPSFLSFNRIAVFNS